MNLGLPAKASTTEAVDSTAEVVFEFLQDAAPQPVRMSSSYCSCSCWGEFTSDDVPTV
jgi:hypothetical protein